MLPQMIHMSTQGNIGINFDFFFNLEQNWKYSKITLKLHFRLLQKRYKFMLNLFQIDVNFQPMNKFGHLPFWNKIYTSHSGIDER